MKLEDIEAEMMKAKVEDGDIVAVNVPEHTSETHLRHFKKHLEKRFIERGLDVILIVSAGKVTVSTAKRNDLADLKQRMDDLETKLDQLGFDYDGRT